jgi:hypothetical protein
VLGQMHDSSEFTIGKLSLRPVFPELSRDPCTAIHERLSTLQRLLVPLHKAGEVVMLVIRASNKEV